MKQEVETEISVQVVKLIFGLGATVLTVWLMRKMMQPDAFRTMTGRALLGWKRVCDAQADKWTSAASNAATAYQKNRAGV